LYTGEESRLVLPVRTAGKLDDSLVPFEPPEGAAPLAYESLRSEEGTRTVMYDVTTGRLQMVDRFDDGRKRISYNGIVYDSLTTNTYSIAENDPLSARVECNRRIEISREDWQTRVETQSILTSDAGHFYLTNVLDAYEGQARIFTKSCTKMIPRNCV
jgi:hypothetical protein